MTCDAALDVSEHLDAIRRWVRDEIGFYTDLERVFGPVPGIACRRDEALALLADDPRERPMRDPRRDTELRPPRPTQAPKSVHPPSLPGLGFTPLVAAHDDDFEGVASDQEFKSDRVLAEMTGGLER